MVESDKNITLIDSVAICEYFEETVDKAPMISGTAINRAEIRRLTAWFDQQFFGAVVEPLMSERMLKRLVHRASPDTGVLREAMKAANGMLDYADYLLDHRNWLAGATLSLADLTAAAHISVADYLGGIDWRAHEQTRNWYSGLKSRPSFRPMLAERMGVIAPPPDYDKVDF
ncbi:MAG: glutathione S-transferase family protein [Sphingomonadales bacterium]|nr:glutathione S-transferase family protein [Sphingomonadales bacterium]